METPAKEAEQALEMMRQSRERLALAAAANCPPARHLAFAVLLGGVVAAQAAPPLATMGIECLCLAGVGLVIAWDRRRTGMFINGYRAGRTRGVTFTLLAVTFVLGALGVWLKLSRGIVWAPVACGLATTVIAYFASIWWQRIYLRELRETP